MSQTHYLVYKITNNINGRQYIGVHSTRDPDDNYMGSGLAIKSAIKKYGVENFTKEIIASFDSFEEAFELEAKLVTLESIKEANLYNLAPGGLGGTGKSNTGRKLTKEHREKISQATKGLVRSEITRKRMSESRTGWGLGRTLPIETRKKMSEVRKGRKISDETKRKISKALTGKPGTCHTDESKRKISESLTGLKRSDETKKKMSEAQKR